MPVIENLNKIKATIPANVKLIAVSKTYPNDAIMAAYQNGQRIFGENKVQELVEKQATLPRDIQWHFIGHLQSNKVKYIAPFVTLIHSVDKLKLLKEINKQALKNNRTIDCLLQFHIAREESKFGLTIEKAEALLNHPDFSNLRNIRIAGVMGMATFTENKQQVRSEFARLKQYFDLLKSKYFQSSADFTEISMGMSGDYEMAIENGSTMVRIGSAIFGKRTYQEAI